MNSLLELVQRYTVQHDKRIKSLCRPLKDYLGIPLFSYTHIETDGRFGVLSNFPEQLEYFYSEKLYMDHPYLRCPSLFQSGVIFTLPTYNPEHLNIITERFQIYQLFTIIERNANTMEVFIFAYLDKRKKNADFFYANLGLLLKFTRYFKREAAPLISKMLEDGYNLKTAKGDAFLAKEPIVPLSSLSPNSIKFLNAISPLTLREQQCLDLFKQGRSAQATAAILGLSQRTVEYYFDNIKEKFGCSSKWQLLEF